MRFAVKFLGCKVSQADAMLARRALLAAGHEEVTHEQAELHVINTCCITGEAEAKSRQSVRRSLQSARQVFVGGCAVNLHADQFAAIDPAVTPFVGTADDVAEAIAGSARRMRGSRARCAGARRSCTQRAPAARRVVGRSHARLRQGPGRL